MSEVEALEMAHQATTGNGDVIGVSLSFLYEFLQLHRDMIDDNTTTADVVKNIIIPETAHTKLSYVQTFLNTEEKSTYVSNLDKHSCNRTKLVRRHIASVEPKAEDPFLAFLSHAWIMPFRILVEIAKQASLDYYCTNILPEDAFTEYQFDDFEAHKSEFIQYEFKESEIKDSCYFWIDIFCKNQHIPSPAIEEFHRALKTANHAVISMWPLFLPTALDRIWCIFEIWTASKLKIHLQMAFTKNDFELFASDHIAMYRKAGRELALDTTSPSPFDTEACKKKREPYTAANKEILTSFKEYLDNSFKVDVRNAKATVPEDREIILDLIKASELDIDNLNESTLRALEVGLCKHLRSYHEPCIMNRGCSIQ